MLQRHRQQEASLKDSCVRLGLLYSLAICVLLQECAVAVRVEGQEGDPRGEGTRGPRAAASVQDPAGRYGHEGPFIEDPVTGGYGAVDHFEPAGGVSVDLSPSATPKDVLDLILFDVVDKGGTSGDKSKSGGGRKRHKRRGRGKKPRKARGS